MSSTAASRACSASCRSTATCTSPARPSTTRRCSCGRPTPCTWATRSCSWTSGPPRGCCELIDRHQVTTSHMVPTQFHRLLALPEDVRGGYDVSSLRCMVHARRPLPTRDQAPHDRVVGRRHHGVLRGHRGRRHHRRGPGVADQARARWAGPGRGPRSASSTTTTSSCRPAPRAPSTWRWPRPTSSTRATEPRPTRTAPKGFFTVGDWGLLDDDGYLFLKDRKSDMIISGGVNIYPAEIEGTLLTFPKIGDVAVFGIPNEDWGEEIKVVVQPAEGVEPDDALPRRDRRLRQGEPGQLQATQVDRLPARAAPRSQRQALQAQAPRSLLGRPRHPHLSQPGRHPQRRLGTARCPGRVRQLRQDRSVGPSSAAQPLGARPGCPGGPVRRRGRCGGARCPRRGR